MKVELLSYTPNPEQLVAAAAKLCYSPVGISDILEKQSDEAAESFLERLMAMGHESPLEHIQFTFGVEGVSRILETQLVRHRHASYSVQSGRYVKRDAPDFVTPEQIKRNARAQAIYEQALTTVTSAYNELVAILLDSLVREHCIENELSFVDLEQFKRDNKVLYGKLEKIALEDARYIYPQSLCTKLVFSMNARGLINFLKHRGCRRAQKEINELSWLVKEALTEVCPTIAKHLGPSCLTKNKCSEGIMCCGKPYKLEKRG